MNKLALGTDFTDEEGAKSDEEAEKIKPDESQDDEKENSADDADSKTQDDSIKKDSADSNEDDSSEEPAKVVATIEDKRKELQGLLGTEKALDEDVVGLDEQIKAARTRISQRRGERREKRDLTQSIDSALPPEETPDDLSDIDPETLKVLDRFTKAKGLVPKSELSQMTYQSAHKTAEDAFYESHPEYKPENDDNDLLYNALKTELSLYSTPKDAKLIPKLFEKAHSEVRKLYPDKFKKTAPDKKEISEDTKAAAGRIKKQQTGGGPSGGSSGGGSTSSKTVSGTAKTFTDVQITALKDGGWSDEDIKRLTT